LFSHSTEKAVSLDIKAVRAYSSLVANNVTPADNRFLAFVIYNNKFENPDTTPEICQARTRQKSQSILERRGEP